MMQNTGFLPGCKAIFIASATKFAAAPVPPC